MGKHGRPAALGLQGDIGEERSQHDTEQTHSHDTRKRIAGIVHTIVVPRCNDGCMPYAPDKARNEHRGQKLHATGYLG